jgi:hypothetical protein
MQDEYGLFRVVKAEQIVEVVKEVVKEVEPKVEPKSPATTSGEDEKDATTKDESTESDKPELQEEKGKEEKKKETETEKKMVRFIRLKVEPSFRKCYNESDLLNSRSREEEFAAHDSVIKATMDAKNSLEEFVYTTRDKLCDKYKDFATDDERSTLKEKLATTEDWLYDEGYDEVKAVYDERLAELEKMTSVFSTRFHESEERPRAANALHEEISAYLGVVNSTDEKFDHINEEERNVVRQACAIAEKWLKEKLELQADKYPHETPVVKVADIMSKCSSLRKECTPIVKKVKPAPPKKEKAETESTSDESTKETPESDENPKKDVPSGGENNMDVD